MIFFYFNAKIEFLCKFTKIFANLGKNEQFLKIAYYILEYRVIAIKSKRSLNFLRNKKIIVNGLNVVSCYLITEKKLI